MQSILTIALNDLKAVLRERGTRITLFAVPVIMTVFLGLALGGGSASIQMDVIRADPADPLAAKFVSLLRDEAGSQFIVCDLAAPSADQSGCNLSDLNSGTDLQTFANARVKASTSFAAITVPAGFGTDTLAGKSTTLTFTQQGGLNAPGIIQEKVNAV